jgi:ferredoxin-NADP reductase
MLEAATFAAAERPLMFICGPTAFVERVAELAVAMGHAPNMIKTERFGG